MNIELLSRLSAITPEEQRLLAGQQLDKKVYTSSNQFVIESDKLLESGKMISIRPHTRFVDFPPHAHNYVELMYMCSGSTIHMINDALPLTLQAGELLFLNQHVSHAIKCADVGDVAVNFIVMPQFFDTAIEMIGVDNLLGQFLLSSLQKEEGGLGFLHFKVSDILPVQHLVENMIWGIVEHQANNRKISQVTMALLFLQLLNYTERMQTTVESKNTHTLVVEALREIEENYKDANLSGVAQRYKVSVAYLSHLIKETTGVTFKTLLQQKRLAKAKQLLLTTGLAVGEIIAAVGYENTSYFYRIFKQEYGMAPSDYRKSTK